MATKLDPGFKPDLHMGDRDLAVRALQNALHRGLHAKGIEHHNLRNGAFGSITRDDVNRFEHAYGIRPVTGRTVGEETWDKLTPFLGKQDKMWLSRRRAQVLARNVKEAKRIQAIEKASSSVDGRLEAAITLMWSQRGHLVYSWLRPFNYNPRKAHTYDCSGTVSVIYYLAGLPDPNGLGHNGFGFTGTMWPRGTYVGSNVKMGDLAFYGYDSRGNYPSHVAIVITAALASKLLGYRVSGWYVLSFGSNPMRIAPLRYRSDFRGARRYR